MLIWPDAIRHCGFSKRINFPNMQQLEVNGLRLCFGIWLRVRIRIGIEVRIVRLKDLHNVFCTIHSTTEISRWYNLAYKVRDKKFLVEILKIS